MINTIPDQVEVEVTYKRRLELPNQCGKGSLSNEN